MKERKKQTKEINKRKFEKKKDKMDGVTKKVMRRIKKRNNEEEQKELNEEKMSI